MLSHPNHIDRMPVGPDAGTNPCQHTRGFRDMHPAIPGLYEGVCIECNEPRLLDTTGSVYRTEEDARHGRAERRRMT